MTDVPADSKAPSNGPAGASGPPPANGHTAVNGGTGTPAGDTGLFEPGPANGSMPSGPPTGEIRIPGGLVHIPPVPPEPQPGPADAQAPTPGDPPPKPRARVKGRIDIADEVVEKVTAAAAYEVDGVADLGGNVANALETMRQRIGIGRKRDRRDDGRVSADIEGGEAEIDVAIMVKYGYGIVDVARRVQVNVAHQAHIMLGLKVVAVNVTIEDIEMPEDALTYKEDDRSNRGYSIET